MFGLLIHPMPKLNRNYNRALCALTQHEAYRKTKSGKLVCTRCHTLIATAEYSLGDLTIGIDWMKNYKTIDNLFTLSPLLCHIKEVK